MEADPDGAGTLIKDVAEKSAADTDIDLTQEKSVAAATSENVVDEEAIRELSEGVKLLSTESVAPADDSLVIIVQSEEPPDDGQNATTDASEAATAAAAVSSTLPSSASTVASTLSIPGLQKKFTSLSVNKQFLEKASPTMTASTAPIVNKVTTSQPLGRLVSSSPASRLTSAKLSTSIAKPQSAGWGQIASPGLTSPGTDPLPSGLASSSAFKIGASSASPKLVTALTSGSAARSTSPHQKGSPGLRNASLAASGRGGVSGAAASSASNSKAPWAAVKTENTKVKSALATDFPTAAEAARAKLEAERREKQAAAEAAARAEQTLQQLERYRGTSIGPGNHWDEMDDEDDLDEVVQFGDGTQYKVPAKKEEEPVSKEERFKDVGHDRSWPLGSSQQAATATQAPPPVPRPQIATRTSSTRDPSLLSPSAQETPAAPPKLFNSRHATKLEIKSGESVSLETEVERGYSSTQRGNSFYRRDRDGGDIHAHSSRPSHAQAHVQNAAAAAAPVRAWGPLAQRQASLNPDAPKPVIASPPASTTAASIASPTLSAATSQPLVRKESQQSNDQAIRSATAHQDSNTASNERAMPPHLAAQAASSATSESAKATRSDHTGLTTEPIQATPYGARFGASALSPTLAKGPPTILKAESAAPAVSAETQREEMLSAAERARKRRQEEEEKRLAEKERAKAKAAAIEEKMRLAKEEEDKKRRADEEVLQQKRIEADEKRRQEAARVATPASILQPDAKRDANARPALLSPSDEAVSWRKAKPIALLAPEPSEILRDSSNTSAKADQHAFQDIRPVPLETAASQPVTLLQRPAAEILSPTNGKAPVADVSKTRNGNAMIDQRSPKDAKIPTGPRGRGAAASAASAASEGGKGMQIKGSARAPKVDIIAPTDERAALHQEEQEKQREIRQSQKSPGKQPVGVLKTSVTVALPPIEAATRKEVEFDGVPVWNRYKIKVGTSRPSPKLPFHIFKAQRDRIAESRHEGSEAKAVEILSWDPPMPYLSSRTLSRDDLFHSKKYRKGVIIASVAMPKGVMHELKGGQKKSQQESIKESVPLVVKVPSFKTPAALNGSFSAAQHTINSRSNGLRSNAADVAMTSVSPSSRESLDPVTYSTSVAARVNTPSPVSFMTSSEVNPGASSQVSLPLSPMPTITATPAAPPSTLDPSTSGSNSNATWGQASLFNLNASASSNATADRERIREVWAHSSHESGNVQNSLKDIVDEFPDVAAQYHDVGINTNEAAHHSAPTSRIYSPVVNHHNLVNEERSNGYGTSASSPSLALATAQGLEESEETLRDVALLGRRAESKRTYPPSQQSYAHDQRRLYHGNAAAFSAYAYPSPIDEVSQNSFYSHQGRYASNQNQRPSTNQQQRYAAYDKGVSEGNATAYASGGGYGSYRSSSNPASHHHGGNMSSMGGSGAHGSPHQQHSGSYYSGQQNNGYHQHSRSQNPNNSPGSLRNIYPQGAARGSGASASPRDYRSNDPSSTVW